ncbi:alpha-protein kinase 1-like [Phymastichus coffea]|uniref:alpha-protein kinase 1-like n=1 Tax=Phymastichus coffea TaxID=108790 RepID=UPI00273B78D7|nr:alpha-protein kinase 1-like [Phymastichus coffea]
MRTFLVILCFSLEAFFVQALSNVGLEGSETKKLNDWKIDGTDISLEEEKSPDSQRKRDPGYYYDKPNRFISNNYFPPSRHIYTGRVVNKLHKQVNRPFNQYGPPKHGSSSPNHNHPTATNTILNQDVPIPIRQTEFVEESSIASQNNLPFGQHTANYLPPKNQKLPSSTAPHLFSNQNHDFPRLHQQLQLQLQQQQQLNQLKQEQREQQLLQHQQQQLNHVQQQQLTQVQQEQFNQLQQQFNQLQQQQSNQVQQQDIQLQIGDQNSFGQDFNTFSQQQNGFHNQQISDAALFLSQNAPAISQLYETPAHNQNYAPYNQESQQRGHNWITSQNLQVPTQNDLSNQQLPSHSSEILNTQRTLEDIKSLEKDRLISQLRLQLSNRENAARFVENNEDIGSTQNQHSLSEVSPFSPSNPSQKFEHIGTSFSQSESFSSPSTAIGSSGYPTIYPPPVVVQPTKPPVLSTSSPPISTILPPNHSNSESGSTQIGSSLPAPENTKPPTTSAYPNYGGFVPTLVTPANFVPNIPSFGTALFPPSVIKPTENAPTHFGIPIPTLLDENPVHPSLNPPTTLKPTSISLQPGISTVSIPLGPIHHFPSHPQVIKPSLIPIVPAATSVHPTYGIHPAVINPSFVYKPVKVYPVYHYPHLGYSSPVRKSIYSTTIKQPWSYAPSYGQAKPIWK